MTLLDSLDSVRATELSDARDRIIVRADWAGRYRLRAERIGYETVTSAPVQLAAGDRLDIVSTAPIPLEPLRVVSPERARDPRLMARGFFQRHVLFRHRTAQFFGPQESAASSPWKCAGTERPPSSAAMRPFPRANQAPACDLEARLGFADERFKVSSSRR